MNFYLTYINKFQSIFANSTWLFANYLLKIVGGYFISIWLARYLGPQKYGAFNYAIANLSIFGGIAAVGLTGVFVKFLLKNSSKEAEIMGTAFIIRFIGSIICFLGLAGFILLNAGGGLDDKYILSAIVAVSIIITPTYVIDLYFEAKLLAKKTALARSLAYLLRTVLMVAFIMYGFHFLWLGAIIVIEEAVGSFLSFRSYMRYSGTSITSWKFDRNIARRMFSESWPLIISTVGAVLYLKLDQIMIVEMSGETEGGYYSAAVRLSEIFYFIPTVLMTSLFPVMVKKKKADEGEYYGYIKKIMFLFAVLSLCIILPVALFADYAILYTFGKLYLSAVPVVRIHIYGLYFIFLAQILSKWLIVEELTKFSLVRTLTGLVLNVVLNLLLIPNYGGEGAAIATLVSLAGAVVIFAVFDVRTRPFLGALGASLLFPLTVLKKYVK